MTIFFDVEKFRKESLSIIELLVNQIKQSSEKNSTVIHYESPNSILSNFTRTFSPEPKQNSGDFISLLKPIIDKSINVHHPHFVGHQVSAPLPEAVLCDFISSFLNNGSAVYEMGQVAAAIECRITQWMAGLIGWNVEEFSGFFTSGGSLGNLTALLAARQAMTNQRFWNEGSTAFPNLAIMTSEHSHYCSVKAAHIMGLGAKGVITVPVNNQYQIDTAALESCYQQSQRDGKQVFALVASACSTSTGSFDDLEQLAAFCSKHNIWLHVDGAHGASVALCPEYRYLIKGLERADSVVWDAHKMLMMPALATAVLFKQKKHAYQNFSQKADYLYNEDTENDDWYTLGKRTFECTKNMMALKLYVCLTQYGTDFFADYIRSRILLTKSFYALLCSQSDFEADIEPECNIICFRFFPKALSHKEADALQEKVQASMLSNGTFYLVKTTLSGRTFLRTTIINPTTSIETLKALIAAIRKLPNLL